jgi:hypothetical protein
VRGTAAIPSQADRPLIPAFSPRAGRRGTIASRGRFCPWSLRAKAKQSTFCSRATRRPPTQVARERVGGRRERAAEKWIASSLSLLAMTRGERGGSSSGRHSRRQERRWRCDDDFLVVIASESEAIQGGSREKLDCFVAVAPRNDEMCSARRLVLWTPFAAPRTPLALRRRFSSRHCERKRSNPGRLAREAGLLRRYRSSQ